MSFPRYPKYKASGVEWLGDVPDGWEVKRARAVGVFTSSGIDKKSVDGEQEVQMFNYLDVYKSPDKILRYSEDLMWTTAPASKVTEHSVMRDDILLTPSSETADDIGHAARVTSVPPNILYSYHILRFRKGVGFDAPFVTHCFNAVPIRSYFESVCTGTTRKVLVRDDFKNAPFAIPPLPEQTAIAEFLDRETGKIDELVAEQRRLMELLKEKRQAVISHAVTKGLNPHAPMKPSGIEWLGDVPVGWDIGPIKYFVVAKNGAIKTGPFGSHLTSSDMQAGPIKVYNQRTVIDCDFVSGDNYISEDKFAELANFETFPGDLLITTRGTIGRAAILPKDAERGILHPCLLRLQPNTSKVDTVFLKALIQDSDLMKTQLSYLSNATTIEVIYSNTMASVVIPVPPLSEQREILQFVADETAKFDTLTAEAQRAIDLLQERRTALISAAVTGQIDVRQQPKN